MGRLLLSLAILHIVYSSCPDGWDLARNGQCRGLYATVSDIYDDQMGDKPTEKCKDIGAEPVIIHDEEDNLYWSKIAASAGQGGAIILSLFCDPNTYRWTWGDGSAVDYKPAKYTPELDNDCSTLCNWYLNSTSYWKNSCGHYTYDNNFYCTKQLPPLPVPSSDGCDNFDDDVEDGICYQVGGTAANWQEAQIVCRSFGAEVAAIHNQKENSFIRRLAVSKAQVTGVYLGATLSGKGNDFSWNDGSNWDYANFYPGFPMKGYGDCLLMDTESSAGQWANVDCSSKMSVACMRQRKNTTNTTECPPGPFVEGQIMYSPGFPFDASTPCDYLLSVEAGKRVEVEVLMLEANSCSDQLVFFEDYFGGTVIANLTGEMSDKKYTTASSNFMRVSWRPNGGVNVRGTMFTFRGV